MQLRPHHALDILTGFGQGRKYQAHPYGHSQHIVASKLFTNLDEKIKLVLTNDEVCKGCKHLLPDGKCKDVLSQLSPSPKKQAYNDVIDSLLFDVFKLEPNIELSLHEYLEIVNENVPGIEQICTHPKQSKADRLLGLTNGLIRLGIREAE